MLETMLDDSVNYVYGLMTYATTNYRAKYPNLEQFNCSYLTPFLSY